MNWTGKGADFRSYSRARGQQTGYAICSVWEALTKRLFSRLAWLGVREVHFCRYLQAVVKRSLTAGIHFKERGGTEFSIQ